MSDPKLITEKGYEQELHLLQVELIKLQYWIQSQGLRAIVLFEGRDAAGKGGVIRRITQYTNPRIVRLVALPKPTERERGQWYFQRYVAHLPRIGEMVLFDRSWYNRAGVEAVMGFCSETEVQEFFTSCPQFEKMLVDSGIKLIKYWFTISREEQERRFQARRDDPLKRWKLSTMDLEARFPLGGLHACTGPDVCTLPYRARALDRDRREQQETGASELHPPPAVGV